MELQPSDRVWIFDLLHRGGGFDECQVEIVDGLCLFEYLFFVHHKLLVSLFEFEAELHVLLLLPFKFLHNLFVQRQILLLFKLGLVIFSVPLQLGILPEVAHNLPAKSVLRLLHLLCLQYPDLGYLLLYNLLVLDDHVPKLIALILQVVNVEAVLLDDLYQFQHQLQTHVFVLQLHVLEFLYHVLVLQILQVDLDL